MIVKYYLILFLNTSHGITSITDFDHYQRNQLKVMSRLSEISTTRDRHANLKYFD